TLARRVPGLPRLIRRIGRGRPGDRSGPRDAPAESDCPALHLSPDDEAQRLEASPTPGSDLSAATQKLLAGTGGLPAREEGALVVDFSYVDLAIRHYASPVVVAELILGGLFIRLMGKGLSYIILGLGLFAMILETLHVLGNP